MKSTLSRTALALVSFNALFAGVCLLQVVSAVQLLR